jgi:hypothetical protein
MPHNEAFHVISANLQSKRTGRHVQENNPRHFRALPTMLRNKVRGKNIAQQLEEARVELQHREEEE